MSTSKDHPCWGDEGIPLVINEGGKRRLVGVGHGSHPIEVYRRKRHGNETLKDWNETLNNEESRDNSSERMQIKKYPTRNNDRTEVSENAENCSKINKDNRSEVMEDRIRRSVWNNALFSCGQSDRYYVFTNPCYHLTWIHQAVPKIKHFCHYVNNIKR
uniref:Uncharacterized protein n=1 Tax=Cacopsylla melanoneura TaxID=428564 RepID=A0A8D8T1C3_9HEMI